MLKLSHSTWFVVGLLIVSVPMIEDLPAFASQYGRTDYGQRIEGIGGEAEIWWCEATWKIAPQRSSPEISSPSATLSAARNDHEAVQIVVRPSKELKQFTVVPGPGPLNGPGGAKIPAENVQVLQVYYHYVHTPTEPTGLRDWWPDALPPLDKPLDLPINKNQPLWVLIHVPKDAKAGDYRGSIVLKADEWSAIVPLRLHVWDFTLPDQNHIETAFGLTLGNIFRYHQINDDADKRRVLRMYLKNFAEHRISPYDPAPLDPIRVKFLPKADPPKAELDFSAFDAEMTRVLNYGSISSFRLPLKGMRGGTYNEGKLHSIGNYDENTSQYKAMFSSYVKQLESHLREKNWLKMAYIYWFDEPGPEHYSSVRAGMERLKKYAPDLQIMVTEQPEQELAGPVDIWCPLSFNYNHDVAEQYRKQGDRFWWYVCSGPKAPFCTLFIDHPATDLRVWLWQAWQRNIVGILVWQTNYWTSPAEFPDEGPPQNPYKDPMSYRRIYNKPSVKQYWHNGDGRFIYPPMAAAIPGILGNNAVIAPPVSSIRWEMLREGIEDYEYLWLLRDLIAEHQDSLKPEQLRQYKSLLEVPEAITRDMTTFTTDPTPIYRQRAAVAEAIENLCRQR